MDKQDRAIIGSVGLVFAALAGLARQVITARRSAQLASQSAALFRESYKYQLAKYDLQLEAKNERILNVLRELVEEAKCDYLALAGEYHPEYFTDTQITQPEIVHTVFPQIENPKTGNSKIGNSNSGINNRENSIISIRKEAPTLYEDKIISFYPL